MSSVEGLPVIQYFADISGKSLDDGFVYIGTSGLDPVANPISVFWDAALTIPAPNPIRTRNGHPDRSGVPARFFADTDSYSFAVKNKNGTTIYTALDSLSATDLERRLRNNTDPAKGAGMVGWSRSALSASLTTAHQMLDAQAVSVWEFANLITVKPTPSNPDTWDWTPAFVAAFSFVDLANDQGYKVVAPPGKYRLTDTIEVHSWTSFFGSGRWQTDIICDHDGPVFQYIAGDNVARTGSNAQQCGDNEMAYFRLLRETMPVSQVVGNYGIDLVATFGITKIHDIDFLNLGDSCIHYADIANPNVGSGPIHLENMTFTALHGWLVEFENLFAQIFVNGLSSVRSGAGLLFDGSTAISSFRGFNVSIRDCNIESVGLGPGGVLAASPQPALKVLKQHCVLLEGNYFSVHTNNPNGVVEFDDVTTASLSGTNAIVASGTAAAGCIKLTNACGRVDIGRSTLLEGVDTAAYAISSDGTLALAIRLPRITGFLGNQLVLTGVGGSTPVLIESIPGVVNLNANFSGSLTGAYTASVSAPRLADVRGVGDNSALYVVSGGALTLLSSFGMTAAYTGVGVFTFTFTTAKASSVYIPTLSVQATTPVYYTYSGTSATGFVLRVFDTAGAPVDPARIGAVVFEG